NVVLGGSNITAGGTTSDDSGLVGVGAGGGIANVGGNLNMIDSTVFRNEAAGGSNISGSGGKGQLYLGHGLGGGIADVFGGVVTSFGAQATITNGTISFNFSQGGQGGSGGAGGVAGAGGLNVSFFGVATVRGATFFQNNAQGGAGGSGANGGSGQGGAIEV